MKSSRYHLELGATAACTNKLMEEINVLGQRDLKRSIRDCFLFYSWFSSNKSEDAAFSIIFYLIGIVKTNTKVFFKATIKWLTKYWPGGSYILLRSKHMVPGERTLLTIEYNYNSRKVL